MGLTGFLLLSARSAWTQIEDEFGVITNVSSDLPPVAQRVLSEMAEHCPACNAVYPHLKMAAYATGVLVGGVAIGWWAAQRFGGDKIVDSQDIEDVGEKRAYCRCWKSHNFPYCDGTHVTHNKATGDNVGPLIVSNTKKPAAI
ncbi:Iron sulfur-containing domain containing protein [Aphelenchoides fujianensis]|nr:Iron sulfur-containing domain containing protein [Aphelenchoides fujianensis]